LPSVICSEQSWRFFAQSLIEQRLLGFDHLRFQQQRTEIACCGDPAYAP